MEGNYNSLKYSKNVFKIIPLREMEGNYNLTIMSTLGGMDYTLERDGRELQRGDVFLPVELNYTLERDGRELQLYIYIKYLLVYYTLERDGRELQLRLRLYRAFLDYTLERDGRELQR